MKIEAHGIAVELPSGWEGEIDRRPPSDAGSATHSSAGPTHRGPLETNHPVTHLANFALPSVRGDFGSGAVERMSGGDVLIALLEYGADDAGTALFAHDGVPTISPGQFSPAAMQRPIEGQSGTQVFFHSGARAFCLYVVLGSHARRRQIVPVVNDVLATLELAPG